MRVKELAFHVATFQECGIFENIKENGWKNQQEFLQSLKERHKKEWCEMPDGRIVMNITKEDRLDSGLSVKYVVLDGWVATYNYEALERKYEARSQNSPSYSYFYDDDDDWSHDDPYDDDDYLDDYNDDYGWWR